MNLPGFLALILVSFFTAQEVEDDLRKLAGLGESDVSSIADGQELDTSNTQFKKLLYRTGTVDGAVLSQWSNRTEDISLNQFSQSPERYRFYPVSLAGEAVKVQRFNFSANDAKDFLRGFFIVRCRDANGAEFNLVSRSTVSSWPTDETLDPPQPIVARGFFLGNLSVQSDSAVPVFVVRRFSWFPTEKSEALNVDSSLLALSNAGLDIALLDIVRGRIGQPIGNREKNGFWQMLAATRSIDFGNASRIDLVQMLSEPVNSIGNAASIQGRIRQCTPVKVAEKDAVKLLGTDIWYQLTVFPDLDGRPIRVATKDGGPEIYPSAFPVTVCLLDLPEGEDRESIIGENYLFDGVFYRIWSYPSERTENTSLSGQPSPLIMSHAAQLVPSSNVQLQAFLYAIVAAMLVATGTVVWFLFRTKVESTRDPLPEKLQPW